MVTPMNRKLQFGVLIALIIGTVAWLAFNGVAETATYYKTIAEVDQMGNSAVGRRFRVIGDVESGSIQRSGREVRFKIKDQGKLMTVIYSGIDPLPDTFRDGAQALADGQLGRDGVFQANKVQAKCASKYEGKWEQKKTAPINNNPAKS
jgi:cytochrome c-type biogenesis protein CcmE